MSWIAKGYSLETGEIVAAMTVYATDMHKAEERAISKACLETKGDPRQMTVRELHQRGGAR